MSQVMNDNTLRNELEAELTTNILPFWMQHVADEVYGGFYGALTNDLQVRNDVPRSAVLCARILWTYSRAHRQYAEGGFLGMARRAYDYLRQVFWDREYSGLYWQVDCRGRPVADRKHHYAQAFGIYGLSEYFLATEDERSLELAQELFRLLEEHGFDSTQGGYIEGKSRRWEPLADSRLSEKDLPSHKSTNTMLHILEAYSNLLRAWDDQCLKVQHRGLLEVFQDHIIDSESGHLRLFFDDRWNSLSPNQSFGHDIETSWLLVEAAELQEDSRLLARARQSAACLATGVLRDGLDEDGSLFSERGPQGWIDRGKDWWAQAEGLVGFYNAYHITQREEFADAARQCWLFIRDRMVDRTHRDWYKRLRPDGTPDGDVFKVGPWECPYHHARACFEMLARLEAGLRGSVETAASPSEG
jgi:mannobiose 2-epimerase